MLLCFFPQLTWSVLVAGFQFSADTMGRQTWGDGCQELWNSDGRPSDKCISDGGTSEGSRKHKKRVHKGRVHE